MNSEYAEEFTLKDLVISIVGFLSFLKSKMLWVILLGLIGAGINGYLTYDTDEKYTARLTFMMDESKGPQGGIFENMEILGGLFGGNKGSDNTLGKILELFESKKIINNTLFKKVLINGKEDFIANHYLRSYGLGNLTDDYKQYFGLSYKQGWIRSIESEHDFKFDNANLDSFSVKENLFLRLIYTNITGNFELGINPELSSLLDENSGIMTLTMKSNYEEITLAILNNIYEELSGFFIEKSVEKQRKTYEIVSYKRDSVITTLKSAEYSLANFKDRNRNLVTVKGYLEQLRLERQVQILNVMYAESVRQLELTDFTLRNMTPIVQIIDLPRRPIFPYKDSWKRSAVMGLVIGGGLMAFCLLVFYFVRQVLTSEGILGGDLFSKSE